MTYREQLPAQCPPDAAEEITVEREVFRVVRTDPPTKDDFRSQRAMRNIRHTKTLFYHDGLQVIEARDAIGGHYVGVMVEPEAGEDRYLIRGASPESLRLFRSGALDLRSLLLVTVSEDWFLGTAPGGFGEPFIIAVRQDSLEHSGFLPEPGFFLHDQVTDQAV